MSLFTFASFCKTVSLFCRVDITDKQISELEQKCKIVFAVNYLFFAHHPTIWTLGKIVPAHTKDMVKKYGMGLALNSMEGREAKHRSISRYCKNSYHKDRWEQIFRHEYVSLIWLREKGYNVAKPSSSSSHYIPKRATENPEYCYCVMEKAPQESKCSFCLHKFRKEIEGQVQRFVNLAS